MRVPPCCRICTQSAIPINPSISRHSTATVRAQTGCFWYCFLVPVVGALLPYTHVPCSTATLPALSIVQPVHHLRHCCSISTAERIQVIWVTASDTTQIAHHHGSSEPSLCRVLLCCINADSSVLRLFQCTKYCSTTRTIAPTLQPLNGYKLSKSPSLLPICCSQLIN